MATFSRHAMYHASCRCRLMQPLLPQDVQPRPEAQQSLPPLMEKLNMSLALGRTREDARGISVEQNTRTDSSLVQQSFGFPKQWDSGLTQQDALSYILEFASSCDRVCPKPVSWSRLYAMLLAGTADRSRARIPPPPPIHGTEWAITSSAMKKSWLRDHLEWAGRSCMLELASSFLRGMPESEWFHD